MKLIPTLRSIATSVAVLLPLATFSAEAAPGKPSAESTTLSAEDINAISERIRQTGVKMRADLKEARERLEAQKVDQEAARKREAKREAASQAQAQREAAQQSEMRKRQAALDAQQTLAAQKQAELERQKVSANAEKLAAKERAAQALQRARQSSGVGAFAEVSP